MRKRNGKEKWEKEMEKRNGKKEMGKRNGKKKWEKEMEKRNGKRNVKKETAGTMGTAVRCKPPMQCS